jgi:hypothetical protein
MMERREFAIGADRPAQPGSEMARRSDRTGHATGEISGMAGIAGGGGPDEVGGLAMSTGRWRGSKYLRMRKV